MTTHNTHYYSLMASPMGQLLLVGNGEALTGLKLDTQLLPDVAGDERFQQDDHLFLEAKAQLEAYFAGELFSFDLPLAGEGTPFQKTVWQALQDIPYGLTETYGGLARRIGNNKASRAVGLANGRNPIAIIVPCHRVIGANGALTGYSGGIERKQWLLAQEQKYLGHSTL